MVKASYSFPQGFLWGTATSSHQVEGRNTSNDWYNWEQQGRIIHNQTSGPACDWWAGRWEEDLDLAAEAGQNAHRFSIEWSRVQPDPETWNEEALLRYREIAQGITDRGMTPVVTLHHFTNPQWLAERGGWTNDDVVALFGSYAERVVAALGDYVTLWCTINEPNVYAVMAYLEGVFPPGEQDLGVMFKVITNLFRAHVQAYHLIHRQQYEARVGLVIHYRDLVPARRWFPPDLLNAWLSSRLFNDLFPNAAKTGKIRLPWKTISTARAKGTQDFLGLNYYTQELVATSLWSTDHPLAQRSLPPDAPVSETGFIAHTPQGLGRALEWALQFNVPVIVTENGVEDSTDSLRPRYLAEHIHQIWRAVNHNWPIKGYFHWTLVDNFEWERGWTQRFGLWGLNRETQERQKRTSAEFYASICRENALTSEMVERYAPESMQALFPED